ncbi:MAG: thioredoxin family protein [Bacteroidales bacterium]|nr:thioredoxin family protein [Bacteroidales bacterium]
MRQITGLKDITSGKKGVVAYFYNTSCSSCEVLRPKIRAMVNKSFPKIEFEEINAQEYPGITAEAAVYASPTIIVYFEGKESIRESRYISVQQLEEKIERYYNMLF